jgi:hypothetical protein
VVGAWAANRKPVLWYTGDGSFGFYAMEMDTMARLGIPVVCVSSNDSGWGMISLVEKYIRPEEIATRGQCNTELYPMRAYEKMVAMWDGYGEKVTDPKEILPAIRRAAANGKPSIINVEVDKESLSPFIEFVKLCGARVLFRHFATLPVTKIVKFLGKIDDTQSDGYCENVFYAEHQTTSQTQQKSTVATSLGVRPAAHRSSRCTANRYPYRARRNSARMRPCSSGGISTIVGRGTATPR